MARVFGRKSEYLIIGNRVHARRSNIFALVILALLILDIIYLLNQKHLVYSLVITVPIVLAFFTFRFGPEIQREQDKSDHFYYGSRAEAFIFFKLSQLSHEYLVF